MRVIELSQIRIDGGTQPRAAIDQSTVDEYAEALDRLVRFPPLVVYFDGVDVWLADGFHRYHAAEKRGVCAVEVDWREGTLEKAKLYAAGANAAHGLRRRDADKRRAIEMVWSTDEGKRWTQEQIAKHCHVHQTWVSKVLGNYDSHKSPTREEKREAIQQKLLEKPNAAAREIAREVGADHKTVAKVREEMASKPAPKPIEPPKPAPLFYCRKCDATRPERPCSECGFDGENYSTTTTKPTSQPASSIVITSLVTTARAAIARWARDATDDEWRAIVKAIDDADTVRAEKGAAAS